MGIIWLLFCIFIDLELGLWSYRMVSDGQIVRGLLALFPIIWIASFFCIGVGIIREEERRQKHIQKCQLSDRSKNSIRTPEI